MVAAVDMVQENAGKSPDPGQERRGLEVYRRALRKGALLRPLGNVIYLMPPLTISEAELERLLDVAFEAIAETTGE
jgi:adenosylmethionine-8-amino-7-oxononanoate aminotransferase